MILAEVDIRFVNLGLEIENMKKSFSIFGIKIAYYGVIIAIALVAGMAIAFYEAKRTGQNVEDYIDFALIAIPCCIVGSRTYYVLFEWDYYKNHLGEIINLRGGGMAIYGSVLAGALTAVIFAKVKHLSFFKIADTACLGLLLGQIIGRWGNFVNMEAFGGYTDNLLAMQINMNSMGGRLSEDLISHIKVVDGVKFIQVHPTFLYESLWNLGLLVLILLFRKKSRFQGEVLCWYIGGYAIGRFWIESLRTDQLKIAGLPVSMIVAAVSAVAVGCLWVYQYRSYRKQKCEVKE